MGLNRCLRRAAGAGCFAFVVERHLLGGFALGHGVALADLFLQRLGGLGHHADFVVHVGVGNDDGDVFVGNGLQSVVNAGQRAEMLRTT
jgi:hypothetical protein